MDFNDYQSLAARTANNHMTRDMAIANWCMGLAGELGELVDPIKKHIFHGKDISLDNIKKEAGDVLWYLSNLMNTLGIDFDDVAESNIKKLKERYPGGFTLGGGIRENPVASQPEPV